MNYFQQAYKCKVCDDYIVGELHKIKSCKCDKGWIDVGTMNNRMGGDFNFMKENWIDFFIKENDSVEIYRDNLLWGSYGINDLGESLLDIWILKKPKAVRKYYSDPTRTWQSPRIDEVLTDKEFKKYNKWLDSIPTIYYTLMKDMSSDHILNIIDSSLQIGSKTKDAFKMELKSRGIDASHI